LFLVDLNESFKTDVEQNNLISSKEKYSDELKKNSTMIHFRVNRFLLYELIQKSLRGYLVTHIEHKINKANIKKEDVYENNFELNIRTIIVKSFNKDYNLSIDGIKLYLTLIIEEIVEDFYKNESYKKEDIDKIINEINTDIIKLVNDVTRQMRREKPMNSRAGKI